MRLSELLFTAGPVVECEGRFLITAGHPGFNSRENNGRGYESREAALAAITAHSRAMVTTGLRRVA